MITDDDIISGLDALASEPPHAIDVQSLVRSGHRRIRIRRGVTAGTTAVTLVLAASVAILLGERAHPRNATLTVPPAAGSPGGHPTIASTASGNVGSPGQGLFHQTSPTAPTSSSDGTSDVSALPSCRADQLAAQFEDLSVEADTNVGYLIFRDVSPRACALRGPVSVVGLSAQGVRDTAAVSGSLPSSGLPMSANAAAIPEGAIAPTSEHVAFAVLGSLRSTQAGYDCPAAEQIVPAVFLVALGENGAVLAAARDPWESDADSSERYLCGGLFGLNPIAPGPN